MSVPEPVQSLRYRLENIEQVMRRFFGRNLTDDEREHFMKHSTFCPDVAAPNERAAEALARKVERT